MYSLPLVFLTHPRAHTHVHTRHQVSPEQCIIEGTVDGLTPGQEHHLCVHEYGDLSSGCERSVNALFGLAILNQLPSNFIILSLHVVPCLAVVICTT